MNKKNQSIIIILLLCIFSLYSKAQNNLFTTQLSKNHSSILTLHENATFTTQPLTRTSNSNHFQQKISIQNQPVLFENTFGPKINLSNQAFSSINKVSGDTGAQDPPEAPLNSDLQLFLILLTLYLSIKK